MNSSPNASLSPSPKSTTSGLLDQSALSDLAQRLVEAAKRAGADAADAIAVRGVSQGVEIREGKVEESERSEGDDVGLRVFVGKRQAVVSTSDIGGDVAKLAERAVAINVISDAVITEVRKRTSVHNEPIEMVVQIVETKKSVDGVGG